MKSSERVGNTKILCKVKTERLFGVGLLLWELQSKFHRLKAVLLNNKIQKKLKFEQANKIVRKLASTWSVCHNKPQP